MDLPQNGDGAQALDVNQLLERRVSVVYSGAGATVGSGDYDVDVASGTVVVDGTEHSIAFTTVTLSTAGSDPRKDIVYVDSTGSVSVAQGTEEPAAPSGEVRRDTFDPSPQDLSSTAACVLAEVWVDGALVSDDIIDRRVFADAYFDVLNAKSLGSNLDADGNDISNVGSFSTDEQSITNIKQLTEFSTDGAWTFFNSPNAIHHDGKTHVGWVSSTGDIEIGSHDHSTGKTTITTLNSNLDPDDHAAPSLLVRSSDSKILVFYSAHNGPSIRWRISSNANDITSFESENSISPSSKHTYMNPWQLTSETDNPIYLFYRNLNSELAYVKSTDGGSSFGTETTLVQAEGTVYFQPTSQGTDSIDISMTHALGVRDSEKRSVRHAVFANDTLTTSDGSSLSLPASFTDCSLVYDSQATGNHDAWVWDTAQFDDGTVQVVFAVFPDYNDHRYWFAEWDGSNWTTNPITAAGSYITEGIYNERYYSPGLSLSDSTQGLVYLSVGDYHSAQVERWRTTDKGATWSRRVLSDRVTQNVRPVVPRNAHDDIPVVWMQGSYSYYRDGGYETAIVGGERASGGTAQDPRRNGVLRARPTQEVGLTSGSWTKVALDTSKHDPRRLLDTTNNKVEIDRSGLYLVEVQIKLTGTSASGEFILAVGRDGSQEAYVERRHVPAGEQPILGGSWVEPFDATEAVAAYVYHNTGATDETVGTRPEKTALTVTQLD